MSTAGLDPSHVMEVGTGFWPSKTLLSAVELDLFSVLGAESMSGEEVGARLALHPRAIDDFLDALVALGFLDRNGEGTNGRYRNSAEAAAFLDKQSPTYVGGFLELCNAQIYGVWRELTQALKTGEPQNEVKLKPYFDEIYSDPAKLEQFMQAMAGLSLGDFHALAERFGFARYDTVCDVGGATGQLCRTLAGRYPHLRCTSYDQPVVAPIAQRSIAAAGLSERVSVASGDFFTDALPKADVITMSHILHDWNLDRKKQLISAAYDALPDGGAFIVVEHLIDDARRDNVFGLMMSLNMLIHFGDAFDFTGSDFAGWCRDAGFGDIEILPLTGLTSAGIAYKQMANLAGERGHPVEREALAKQGELMSSDSFDRAATRLGTAKRHWVTMTTNERGLVIVTGASSRIGEAIALHLGEGGFSVLAGVRRASVSYSFGTPAGEPL